MSKTIEVTFAFEIGDEVVAATSVKLALRAADQYRQTHEAKGGYVSKPAMCVPVFQIIERMAQECPGGIQRHYLCRGYVADKYGDGAHMVDEPIKFLEHELQTWQPSPEGGPIEPPPFASPATAVRANTPTIGGSLVMVDSATPARGPEETGTGWSAAPEEEK